MVAKAKAAIAPTPVIPKVSVEVKSFTVTSINAVYNLGPHRRLVAKSVRGGIRLSVTKPVRGYGYRSRILVDSTESVILPDEYVQYVLDALSKVLAEKLATNQGGTNVE